ncbi:glycosyltransferase family 1 protein [Rhodoferax lacus]|uniref:Glycosyltransferase family 1 protein n=1 Tax=Rhodoferax lacus TaxID=2184758 RepID=A0A3E1RFJ9_9BURK|nr:glycosyltransferase [Rhodoferax lacus]RFO98001.1 glycosyltransferase family 1 protein [Rhodoferax lacus]
MNATIMYAGQANPFVGWLAVDEFAELLAYYLDATLVSPKPIDQGRFANFVMGRSRFEPIESPGGDVLVVVARSPNDLNMAKSISGYRKKFAKIYGIITDSYHEEGYVDVTSEFDAVFVTAHGDMDYVKNKYKINVHQMYQGIDTLRWGPLASSIRSVDIVGFGRMPTAYQEKLIQAYHQPSNPYLYLHSPLGNVRGPTVGLERGMLFKLLQRSKISLAFNLHVGATGDRPISMMVTSRWLESMLSGCIVAGKRPVSRMADDMLSWENSTIELSDNANEAIEELDNILENEELYALQRMSNTYHVMTKHDWRFRLNDLGNSFQLSFNQHLLRDIEIVEYNSRAFVAHY